MALWSRIRNAFQRRRLADEIDEEFESHIAEAIENGRDAAEARAAFGSMLRLREESFDTRMAVWLGSLRDDLAFGWKQIAKRKGTSAAAVLSLGLGIGACTAAFRLIDALLLRPLPVAQSDRLYLMTRAGLGPGGDARISESCEYPLFQTMRAAVRDRAELIAVSYSSRVDLTYTSDEEMEKAYRQYVSPAMFSEFGLRAHVGRVFTESDDITLGAHPYAVLSFDYWSRRFHRDPSVVGRKMRIGNDLLEIVGVGPERFTGTEPGTVIDVFVPALMNPSAVRADSSWFRVLAVLKPGVSAEPLRAQLHSLTRAFNEDRLKGITNIPGHFRRRFLDQTVLLEPAASGASGMQRSYRSSLLVLAALVGMVLLIACVNVANLMTAQAAARAREMALRVSIGAGRWRLAQLVFAESAWLALLASVAGGVFAWWAAPFVVRRINPADDPARLFLPVDVRVTLFGVALTFLVAFVFGLIPALRASAVRPASALKGGDDPCVRRRWMHALVAAQVAFCFLVHQAAGLFVTTFEKLANQPTGFRPEGLLALDVVTRGGGSPAAWDEVAERVRRLPGVEAVAMAEWPLLSGTGRNGFVWVNGKSTDVLNYFLGVSPGWTQTMGLRVLAGRDLHAADLNPKAALVNEAFVRESFKGQNPIGLSFERKSGDGLRSDRYEVVGVVNDARYRNMREPITATVYVPFRSLTEKGGLEDKNSGTLMVRTSQSAPMSLAPMIRREIPQARPEFRVSNVRTQTELIRSHTLRERLLAMLAMFFAAVALLLAAIGLFGVLDYSVLQRRRELGIRIAVGARPAEIVRVVTRDVAVMVIAGSLAGLAAGLACSRYVATLLYQVKATDAAMLTAPAVVILAAVVIAAAPAVARSLRIDPVAMLRAD